MSEIPIDDVRAKAQDALQNPKSETEKILDGVYRFYYKNEELILGTGIALVVLKINKRMVKKVVKKALETTPVRIDLVSYMDDLDAYDKAKYAAAEAAWAGRKAR